MVISIVCFVIAMVGNWVIFKKMGREGWEGIVPFYNSYVLFQELYGNGWKFLTLLIPLYNIYVAIKLYIDLAHEFNLGTGFGIGLCLLPFIFNLILAFGNAQFRDGRNANTTEDFLSRAANKVTDTVAPGYPCPVCGTEIPHSAEFCPNCGAKKPGKKFCSNCGDQLAPGQTFCKKCGMKVE